MDKLCGYPYLMVRHKKNSLLVLPQVPVPLQVLRRQPLGFDRALSILIIQVLYYFQFCTSHSCHSWMSKLFLDQGKHILCEKPMTVDVAEAQILATQADAALQTSNVAFFVNNTILQCLIGEWSHIKKTCRRTVFLLKLKDVHQQYV